MASDSGSITYKLYRHWPGPDQEPIDMASIFRPDIWDAARAWQAFRDFLNGVDDGEMAAWRHALRECRIHAYREGAEHANLAWTTGVRKR